MNSPALQSVFAQVLVASAVAQTSATPRNLLSFNLSAGQYMLSADVHFIPAATTSITQLQAGFNTVTTTLPTADAGLIAYASAANVLVNPYDLIIPGFIIVLPVAATIYLNINAVFTVSTLTVSGIANAIQISP